MYNVFLNGQQALLVLLSAFIIVGIFKTQGLFIPVFTLVSNKLKSKRIGLLCVSLISGILPVEGRSSVSAPILDSLVCTGKDSCSTNHSRAKMGVLDYLATHHYYLWSPLEKSVIILMAGLGLTYSQLLAYTIWPLLAYLVYLIYVIFIYIKEDDVVLIKPNKSPTLSDFFQVVPFLTGLILSMFFPPYIVFPIITVYYILTNSTNVKEVLSFIKWDTLALVAGIIILSNILKSNSKEISDFFLVTFTGLPSTGVLILGIAGGFAVSIALGSSSKYAGVCVALTLLFGIKYFPIILMAEYAGYLLSPVHKCGAISASYFKTKAGDFYSYVGGLVVVLISTGLVQSF
jgi:hypothetical protein